MVFFAERLEAAFPVQTVFRFSRCGAGFGNKKIATQQPEPDHPFRDGLGLGSLCSDRKLKTCSGSFGSRAETLSKICYIKLLG